MSDKEQPVARAAEILGKSPRTVMRWIQSGKVPSKKIDGQWYVDISGVMPSEMSAPADIGSENDAEIADLRAEIADLRKEVPFLRSQLTVKDGEVSNLTKGITSLRSQLSEKDRQIVELHTLLGRVQKAPPNPGKKRWWKFWMG